MNHYTYQANGMEGVKVVEIVPGASADGILEVGDIIVSVIR
ncbi:hypothetical protein [Paenibacillus ihbetae]|nr:hypothetical protein [Paenibacillus ihbetae]